MRGRGGKKLFMQEPNISLVYMSGATTSIQAFSYLKLMQIQSCLPVSVPIMSLEYLQTGFVNYNKFASLNHALGQFDPQSGLSRLPDSRVRLSVKECEIVQPLHLFYILAAFHTKWDKTPQ